MSGLLRNNDRAAQASGLVVCGCMMMGLCLLFWTDKGTHTALALGDTPAGAAAASSASPLKPGVERLSALVPGHCSNPRLSPDGTRIAIERRDEQNRSRQVLIVELETLQERPIEQGEGASSSLLARFNQVTLPVLRDFAWTPRGPFARNSPYVVAGSREERGAALFLAGAGRLTSSQAVEGHPSWAADGRRLAYISSETGEGDLYLLDLAASPRLSRRLTLTEQAAELYPVWSPGKGSPAERICFVRHTDAGDNLHLLENPGKPTQQERPLTRWPSTQTHPSWSPDGKQVAFFSNHRTPDQFDLYVMEASSLGVPRLLFRGVIPPTRQGPSWLPDGSGLIVVKHHPSKQDPLVRVWVESGRTQELETGTLHNQDPEVGLRDGRPYLVFVAQGKREDEADRMWWRTFGTYL